MVLVGKFDAKLTSKQIDFAPMPLGEELQKQIRRFEDARRKPSDIEAKPEDLLLAVMLATVRKRAWPGDPRYRGGNGVVYESRSVCPEPY